MNKKLKGSLIATAVAGMVLSGGGLGVTPASAQLVLGKCKVKNNSCKGKGACGCPTSPLNLCAEGDKNECSGKNSCKGHGWTFLMDESGKPKMMTEEECNKNSPSIFKAKVAEGEEEQKS